MEKPIIARTHFIQEILSIGQTLSNETYIEIKTNNEEHTLIFQTFELLEWLDTNELKRQQRS